MSRSLQTEVVERAIALLEKGWTYGAFARDAHGHEVPVLSERAARFCGLGALDRAHYDFGLNVPIVKLSQRTRYLLATRNDVQGKEEAIRMLRELIP